MSSNKSEKGQVEFSFISDTPRLTVELVPSTCWFSNVRERVSRAQWDSIRRAVYREAGYRCQVCGRRGGRVDCHEMWEYDDRHLMQNLMGLQALCPPCHRVKHFGRSQLRGGGRAELAHLCRVNGWTSGQARKYLDEVWEVWERRSQHKWTLNIAYLKRFGYGRRDR